MTLKAGPPIVATPPSQRVLELDGLRAFAILPVIFYHCYPYAGWFPWLTFVGAAGWIGVDLFFVLSGYLITGILLDSVGSPHYYRNFIVRRTLRIFPLYYLCLAAFTMATRFNGDPHYWASLRSWGGPGWFFFYLGNARAAWVNTLPAVFAFAPLWPLQVEEQFYLLYPLIVKLLSTGRLRRLLIGCVVLAPVLRSSLALLGQSTTEACYVLTPCRMDALALGGIVAIIVRSESAGTRAWFCIYSALSLGGLAIIGAALFGCLDPRSVFMRTIGYTLIDIASAALLYGLVSHPTGRLAALLRWRPLVYTGQIAYGLYLLHGPAFWIARKAIVQLTSTDVPGHSPLSVPITFAASFTAASISWAFFESPILRLKKRFAVWNQRPMVAAAR